MAPQKAPQKARDASCAYIFHDGGLASILDPLLDHKVLCRVHSCAMRVEIDNLEDNKYPWLFRGLSVERVNYILSVLFRMQQRVYSHLNEAQLKSLFTPYDAMLFDTDTEKDLTVAYCIKNFLDPFRQLLTGPHCVSIYELDMPHFGPIYVFRARPEYDEDDVLTFHMLEIKSTVDEILSALKRLNFGGR